MQNNNGLLVGITMVLVFVGGFFLGRMTHGTDMSALATETGTIMRSSTPDSQSDADVTTTENTASTEVSTASLTDGQRRMLETMGIDASSVTITPEMVACAEAKVGVDRVAAYEQGEIPTLIEAGKLAACYTAS